MQAGGVACSIHRSLIFQVLFISEISDITETEFLVFEVASSSARDASKLLLAVVYGRLRIERRYLEVRS